LHILLAFQESAGKFVLQAMKKPKPEVMWAISGYWESDGRMRPRSFLYAGTHLLRKDMINEHTFYGKRKWSDCRKNGDRAIKVLVTPL
jgi:hypothetical protein